MQTLLPHSSDLLPAGFRALGAIPAPEMTIRFYLRPTDWLLASVAETRGRTRVREYRSHPLEVWAVATACQKYETGDRAAAVRRARQILSDLCLFPTESAPCPPN